MVRLRHISAVVAVLVCAAAAQAQSDDQTARARTHFEAGRALYQLGNFNEALREFAAGYQLVPKPQFLLNIGQCYRKLDDLTKAREMYERYLHDAPASDPERPQAEQMLLEIDRQIADKKAASAPPPVAQAPPATSAAQPASTSLTATAPPPHKSWIKRNWWIIPVGAVVVGVGVGLGVYYGTRTADPCSGANLACWDLSK